MGAASAGSLNTSGFEGALKSNKLPSHTHITHPGVFNTKFFEIGPKTEELLDLYLGVGISNCDLFDMDKRNFFFSMFLKSSADGQKRKRGINICLGLDISGSMNGRLKSDTWQNQVKQTSFKTRLDLAKQAIWMLFNKLSEEDIFSLVVFHNTARTVIRSEYVKKLNPQDVKEIIYQKFQSGGTTIRAGFNEALSNIKQYHSQVPNYEHRIVMLTDVGDNSVQNQNLLIEDISNSQSIHTTIIGVSSDFKSETCEKLKHLKGFNYLSAVENSDLQTYLVDRFDYTFFPCVQNVEVLLKADEIDKINTYGAPDDQVKYLKQKDGRFIVTKTKTIFPSELNLNQSKCIETLGGLILVKFKPKNPNILPKIDMKIFVKYEDLSGKKYQKQYVIKQNVQAEEFYSNSATKEGVGLFYYTQTLINLLKAIEVDSTDENKSMYLEKLERLRELCPKEKQQELEQVIKILKTK